MLIAKCTELMKLKDLDAVTAVITASGGSTELKGVDPSRYGDLFRALNTAIAEAKTPAQALADAMDGKVLNVPKITAPQLLVLTTTAQEKNQDLDTVIMSTFGVLPNQLSSENYEEALGLLR